MSEEDKKPGVGVVVGRFQVDQLTEGHLDLLAKANEHARMCIIIGVTSQVTQDNPLDYPSREQMLRESYPRATFLPIHDQPLDKLWVQNLDQMVGSLYQFSEKTFYAGRDSGFVVAYESCMGKSRIVEVDEVPNISGSIERQKIAQDMGTSRAWRAGIIHAAYNQYPRINLCVDIGVTRRTDDGKTQILVGSRVNEGGAYRLPGGHVDVTDLTAEHAAARELHEETGLEVGNMRYVGNFRVKSWRMSKNNVIFTSLYHAEYLSGHGVGMDDLDNVAWMDIEAINTVRWADDHEMLVKHIRTATKFINFTDENIQKAVGGK